LENFGDWPERYFDRIKRKIEGKLKGKKINDGGETATDIYTQREGDIGSRGRP